MDVGMCKDFIVQFIALAWVMSMVQSAAHAPCFSCELYALMHGDQPYAHKIRSKCTTPCECPKDLPKCKAGVNLVKDGCGCCFMCGRQQGEYCDHKRMCDEKRGFICDFQQNGGRSGICRAKSASPCFVEGHEYKDGEQFKPECRRLCTCQNGHYGCVSLCPQEDKVPSEKNCLNPRLVPIPDKCCQEWMCDNIQADNSDSFRAPMPTETVVSEMTTTPVPRCDRQTGPWSDCSQTCGMGISIRITNDNADCKVVQQLRFCKIRPCDLPDGKLPGKRCTPTMKPDKASHLLYKECKSLKAYRPKYCSNCKKNKCCKPHITKSILVKFECNHGIRETHEFMWIKSCICHKRCPRKEHPSAMNTPVAY